MAKIQQTTTSEDFPTGMKNSPAENYLEGTISITSKRVGYVRNRETDISVEIAPENLNRAFHGDKVRSEITGKNDDGEPTGKVTEILSRAKVGFSGVIEAADGRYFLVPSDPKAYTDILIPEEALGGAKAGQKVFVVITDWPDAQKMPRGEVTEVLGTPKENDVEMRAIAMEKGFISRFPDAVEAEAEKLKSEDMEAATAGRRDFRGITTFTIDPEDAKDFDDALSVRKLNDGRYEIGVHIADVSHYVRPDTALDKEAAKRATSVYLVDRTIPMLPEELSNDLCSLKPDVDRLTFSAVFVMDVQGNVHDSWFGRTIIHSDKRFTYEEAQGVLDAGSGPYIDELIILNTIAKKLTQKRFEEGAISLDQEEVKFKLDERGVPISVYKKVRQDTNKLIEEFMLLANRKVAEFIGTGTEEKIFVYRIHDLPDVEKTKKLVEFLAKLGYKVKTVDGLIPSSEINRILGELEGKDERETVHTAIIRSMAKAVYSTKNIGHFGLAFEHYTHFTSPIRRYPDTIVHRLLAEYLAGRTIKKEDWANYDQISEFSSQREKEAADAERASIKYKQVEYMMTRIGKVFDGVVTGISEWGIFVEEKETKCEGMIRLKDLGNDFFEYDREHMQIIGKKTRRVFQIGDRLRVKVTKADLDKKIIDYALA